MTEILNFLAGISGWLERVMFVFLPPLILIGIPVLLRRHLIARGTRWYFLFTGILGIGYLVCLLKLNMTRYFVPVLLLCGWLAVPGLVGVCSLLARTVRLNRKFQRRLLFLLACLPMLVTGIKFCKPDPKQYLFDFARVITSQKGKDKVILYGLQANDVITLAQYAGVDGRQVSNEFELIDCLFQESCGTTVFLLTSIAQMEAETVFEKQFRSAGYVFPFSLLNTAQYRKRKYLLYRFNQETGDGLTDCRRNDFLSNVPDPLRVTPQKLNEIDLKRWMPTGLWHDEDFLEVVSRPRYTMTTGTIWQIFPKEGEIPPSVTIRLYNSLFWPEAEVTRKLIGRQTSECDDDAPKLPDPEQRHEAIKSSRCSPLLLSPPILFLSPECNRIHLDNFYPAFGNGRGLKYSPLQMNGRFTFDNRIMTFLGKSGTAQLSASDEFLGTTTTLDLSVWQGNGSFTSPTPRRILLVLDKEFVQFDLLEQLKNNSSENVTFDSLIAPQGFPPDGINPENYSDGLENLQWPQETYDVVIVGLFLQNLFQNWKNTVSVRTFIPDAVNRLHGILRKQYPNAQMLLLLPPGPAPGVVLAPTRYEYRRLPLAHYALCSRLQEILSLPENADFLPVALYFGLDPEMDFIRTSFYGREVYRKTYALSDSGKRKLAAMIVAALEYHESRD